MLRLYTLFHVIASLYHASADGMCTDSAGVIVVSAGFVIELVVVPEVPASGCGYGLLLLLVVVVVVVVLVVVPCRRHSSPRDP